MIVVKRLKNQEIYFFIYTGVGQRMVKGNIIYLANHIYFPGIPINSNRHINNLFLRVSKKHIWV